MAEGASPGAAAAAAAAEEGEAEAEAGQRLLRELEFVQCLSNVEYVHHLAQRGFLQDEAFLRYLRALRRTWSRPEYAALLAFPQALAMLGLLLGKTRARGKAGDNVDTSDGQGEGEEGGEEDMDEEEDDEEAKAFRREIANPEFMSFVHQQQGLHWQTMRALVIQEEDERSQPVK